jgi:hypothetical protein
MEGRLLTEESNTQTTRTPGKLYDYVIIFDDLDTLKTRQMKQVKKKLDAYDAIIAFADELDKFRRTVEIKSIHTVH